MINMYQIRNSKRILTCMTLAEKVRLNCSVYITCVTLKKVHKIFLNFRKAYFNGNHTKRSTSHITSNCLLDSVGIVVYVCVNSQESTEVHSLKISMMDQNCN